MLVHIYTHQHTQPLTKLTKSYAHLCYVHLPTYYIPSQHSPPPPPRHMHVRTTLAETHLVGGVGQGDVVLSLLATPDGRSLLQLQLQQPDLLLLLLGSNTAVMFCLLWHL